MRLQESHLINDACILIYNIKIYQLYDFGLCVMNFTI